MPVKLNFVLILFHDVWVHGCIILLFSITNEDLGIENELTALYYNEIM